MFSTTHWTAVFRAASEDSQSDRPALNSLLEKYWQPLYAFARHQGLSVNDAEDATQSFLSDLIQGDLLAKANPAKGRFRTYLLTAWKRFLIDRHRYEHRSKRSGAAKHVSLPTDQAELFWNSMANKQHPADHLFHFGWAMGLVDEAIMRIRKEYQSSHRSHVFEVLLPRLTRPIDADDYHVVASQLGVSPGAAKVALHRFRQRFAVTLREVTLETIEDPCELELEIAEILVVLAQK